MFYKKQMLVMLALLIVLPVFGQERGALIFSDNFDTPMTFAENWVLAKGWSNRIKSKDGALRFPQGGELYMRRDTPANFYAEMDLTFATKDNPNGNTRAGFVIDGKYFLISPTGRIFAWRGAAIDGFETGKPVTLTLIRQCAKRSVTFVFLVNEKEVKREVAPLPEGLHAGTNNETDAPITDNPNVKLKPLGIFTTSHSTVVDDVRIYALKDGTISNNVIINSGFEYEQDGFPPYICRSESFDYGKYQSVPYEKYLATCSLDTKEKHSGKQSLKLVNTDFTNGQWLRMHSAATMKDAPGVFSVWMKADQEDFPVTIAYGKAKEVMVDKEWKRYEVVNEKLPKPGIYSPVTLGFKKKKGTLWVDDMQAEILDSADPIKLKSGEPLASPYMPSGLDKAKFREQATYRRAPEITVPKLPAEVVPSEDLDAWKSHSTKLDQFWFRGKAPKNKTEAYLACDDRNVYVGYRCYVKDISSFASKEYPRDSYGIFDADSVEFFLNPEDDSDFYQFAANESNSQFDAGKGSVLAWNGDWKSIAKRNEKTKSIDYVITIPFATLANPRMKSRWLVNLCRNDSAESENITLSQKTIPNFKNTRLWPYAQFPADVTANYALGAEAGGFSEMADGGAVALDMRNLTGKELAVKAVLLDMENNGEPLGSQDVTLEKGTSSLVFVTKAKTGKVRLKLLRNGDALSDQIVNLEKRDSVSMLGRLNYYMKESEAPFRVKISVANPKKLVAVLSCGGVSVKRKAATKFQIALPLKDIPDGTHDVKLALMDGDKTIAETTRVLVKRPYKKGATQINHFARCVMHEGKSVLMSAPFLADIHFFRKNRVQILSDLLAFFKKRGFQHSLMMTVYIDEKNSTKEECIRLLNEANQNDILVVLMTKYNHTTDGKVDEVIKQLDFPNVIGQIVTEEPELSVPSDVTRDFLRKMRPKFPYQPTLMNNTIIGIPAGYANLETDILMLDDYITNMDHRTVYSVVAQTDGMWKAGAAEGKPCWYIVTGGNFPLHYREPSYSEQIAQCYGNIAAGCTGFCYFYGNFQTPGNWKGVLQFNREILSLTDVICSEEEVEEADATGDRKLLRHRTKKFGDALYLISCNIDENPAGKVTFTLPAEYQYAEQAEVLFENRKIRVKDGKFSDEFPGHFRHVYKIKIK